MKGTIVTYVNSSPSKGIAIIVKYAKTMIYAINAIEKHSINMISALLNSPKSNLEHLLLALMTDSKISENHSGKWIDCKIFPQKLIIQ